MRMSHRKGREGGGSSLSSDAMCRKSAQESGLGCKGGLDVLSPGCDAEMHCRRGSYSVSVASHRIAFITAGT
jgi:hypothetical protein